MSATSTASTDFQLTTIIRYEPGLLASQRFHEGVADRFKTISDFYLLAFHQDKVMNAAKHFNWPTQLIERYSGDRGLQVLYAKLLLHIHEDRRADGPLQFLIGLAKDGTLVIIIFFFFTANQTTKTRPTLQSHLTHRSRRDLSGQSLPAN